MAANGHPGTPGRGADAPQHRVGQDVDTVDQVSSVVLLGLALAGAAASLLIVHLLGG